jgi:tRNA(Arg) A34 adenosine deaminase TadA
MSQDDLDLYWMSVALSVAKTTLETSEVPVACVFVNNKTNQEVYRAGNMTNKTRNATKHCEIVAIQEIQKIYKNINIFENCTLYVTVEPCIMCAAALKIVGLKRVVFGCQNERFGGNGSVLSLQRNRDFHLKTTLETSEDDNKYQDLSESKTTLETSEVLSCLCAPGVHLVSYISKGGVLKDEAISILKLFYETGNPKLPPEKRHRR